MASVSYNQHFPVEGSAYYWPPAAPVVPDERGTPPPLPSPQGWLPAPSLGWDTQVRELLLSFTEPPGWSRGPWHLPASTAGFYVPRYPFPASRAWIGAGPVEWSYAIDGAFRGANISTGGPGARTTIPFDPTAPNPATGQPYDWRLSHTFTLHLLYNDVPQYQWWHLDGKPNIVPSGTPPSPWYDTPQDRYRATTFPAGYPAGEPDPPILPDGLTSLSYGGLGPVEVPIDEIGPGDVFYYPTEFSQHFEPGVWLEVVSDPFTLTAPPVPAPLVLSGPIRSVTISGMPRVGETLTAVVS